MCHFERFDCIATDVREVNLARAGASDCVTVGVHKQPHLVEPRGSWRSTSTATSFVPTRLHSSLYLHFEVSPFQITLKHTFLSMETSGKSHH